jgi:hypothetical protein
VSPCPTLSWGAVDQATGYEIEIFELARESGEPVAGSAQRISLPGGSLAWTPASDCLKPGSSYEWKIRALERVAPGGWSQAQRFRVRELSSLAGSLERATNRLAERGLLDESDLDLLRQMGALPRRGADADAPAPAALLEGAFLQAPAADTGVAAPAGATYLYADNGDDYGVYGRGTQYGLYAEGYAPAIPLTGMATHTSGQNKGVFGYNQSTSTTAPGLGGTGASGGVLGKTNGPHASGVQGRATGLSGLNYGVVGTSTSENGKGVHGAATAISGTVYGVLGTGSTSGYDFYAGGVGSNYGPFTGAHEVRLSGDLTRLRPGMVVAATGHAGSVAEDLPSLSATLPTVRIADRPSDPAVLGVFVSEIDPPAAEYAAEDSGDRFATVNALGEGRVLVTDLRGPVAAGDLLTSSPIPGFAQRQLDPVIRNYTLGKVIETIDWDQVSETVAHEGERYRVALVAVVYTSG